MKRIIIILSYIMCIVVAVNAQTYYYKMCSYTQGGTTYTNVSGGQFITFQGIMCMETNINGKPCGNGTLQRTAQNKNMYVGSAFWGSNTKFVFNSDRSSLEVTATDGTVYSYKRSNVPQGVTTSSLIKGRSSSYSAGGAYVVSPVNSSSTPASSSSSGNSYKKTEHPKKCTRCLGNGVCPKCSGRGTYNNMSAGYTRCPSCGGSGKCTMCHGSGTYGSEWY